MEHTVMRRLSAVVLAIALLWLTPTQIKAQPLQPTLALGYCPVEGFIEGEI